MNHRYHLCATAATALALAAAAAASAQTKGGVIDPGAAPAYGEAHLSGGFIPDPHEVAIEPGGALSASSVDGACAGRVASAPDFDLYYEAGSGPLYVTVDSGQDTTLLINAPDGSWICDDDSGPGLNPLVTFDAPADGLYDIWVGSFGDPGGEATLRITEIAPEADDVTLASAVDPGGAPTYGDIHLTAGFLPDPHEVAVTPGGSQLASSASAGCAGKVAPAPDFDLYYEAGSGPLYVTVESDEDTTLLINKPDGTWACDDDSGEGLNPLIAFDAPADGLYDIWVGSFGDVGGEATLRITEIEPSGERVNIAAAPTYGDVHLSGGFLPDPNVVELTAGGHLQASSVSDACAGFVASAPDVDLYFDGGSSPLYVTTQSDGDTTLLINAPDGSWVCDDDSGDGLNALVAFDEPADGLYDIWVGSFEEDGGPASLVITEIAPDGDGSTATGSVDFSAEPYFGSAMLTGGFVPDPHTVAVSPGGSVDASTLDGACSGYIGSAPDFNLTFEPGSEPLYISATSDQDVTLVVNKPDGTWACDDDSAGEYNAGLTFAEPQSGLYNIWVGVFGENDGANATLSISEVGY